MPSSLIHSTLNQLVVKFLKLIDSYNSTDLTVSNDATDQDTSGERARICINTALGIIYDLIKDSKYLESFPSQKLFTTEGQDWVDLDPETFLDDIEAITDTVNDTRLERRSWSWYRSNYVDPSSATGNPIYYIRRNNRIYLAPRPNAVLPLTIDFRKFTEDLKIAGDQPLLPTHYDYWIIAESTVIWYQMEDPNAVPALVISERDSKRQIAMESIMTSYDNVRVAESHFDREFIQGYPYKRPVG